MIKDKVYIYGKHALAEALEHAPQAVKKVFLAPHIDDARLLTLIKKAGIRPGVLKQKATPQGMEEAVSHQGVIGLIGLGQLIRPYEKFMEGFSVTPDASFVLLDEIQDPHNVGAVIRSAAAFGVSGVLIPEHNQAPITGAVVKVSAGMAFRIPLISIGNVNGTIRDLKDRGFWIYGLAGEGKNPLNAEKFDAPAVFVLGNEFTGIREKTRELCDVLLSIPIHPRCESLNVAATAAVALYAWSAQHRRALS